MVASAFWNSTAQEIDLCGTIDSNETLSPNYSRVYVINSCTVDVPSGVTLTIEPGTVIKGDGGSGGCEVENICTLSVEGSLDAVGTPTEPIVFTSINDNSVGGDTGTGSPAAGNWSGIAVSESGSIDLEDTDVSYASTGVDADTTGPAVFKSDEFASSVYEAVLIAAAATPVVEHDSSTGLAQDQTPAFVVDSSSLDLDDIGGNSVTGSGVQAVGLSGTVATSSTLTDQPGAAWDIGGFSSSDGRLDIPSGVTMTIAAGTVIKGDGGSGGCEVENICTLSVEGSLDAVGTPTEPIVFTSINDNSVGGDTGTGSPAAGNWSGIAVSESGSIDLEDTDVSYASTGVDADTTGPAVFKSDEFASSVYEAVLIAAAATPVVEHDSSTGLAQDQTPAFVVDSSSLDLDDIGGNSVTGSGVQAVGLSGTVATRLNADRPAGRSMGYRRLLFV